MTVNFLGSAEAASNRVVPPENRVPPEMLPDEYFLRDELKEKNLVWAAEGENKIKTTTKLSLQKFKALMRIELRKFVSYPASVFFSHEDLLAASLLPA